MCKALGQSTALGTKNADSCSSSFWELLDNSVHHLGLWCSHLRPRGLWQDQNPQNSSLFLGCNGALSSVRSLKRETRHIHLKTNFHTPGKTVK